MRKYLLLFILVLGSMIIRAQEGALTLLTFESYTFADKFQTEYGYGKVGDGFQWGAGLEFGMSDYAAVELIYQRHDSETYYDGFGETYAGDLGINYIMLGVTRYAPANDKVSGFGSFDMGAAFTSTSESLNSDNVTKFALGGRLGARIAPSERFSIRLHAQLMMPVQWFTGGFYFGTGGSGAGVSTGSTIFQFNLGGSVNIRLK